MANRKGKLPGLRTTERTESQSQKHLSYLCKRPGTVRLPKLESWAYPCAGSKNEALCVLRVVRSNLRLLHGTQRAVPRKSQALHHMWVWNPNVTPHYSGIPRWETNITKSEFTIRCYKTQVKKSRQLGENQTKE